MSSSSVGLDAFLSQRLGRRSGRAGKNKEEDWEGEEEEEVEEEGEEDKPSSINSESEEGEQEEEESDEEEEGEKREGEGEKGGGGNNTRRRRRDWESVHTQRWQREQGIEAEGKEGETSPAFSAQRTKRRRGKEEVGKGEEEEERQRKMRELFDKRDGEKFEAFTEQQSEEEGKGEGEEEKEEEGNNNNNKKKKKKKKNEEDAWWAQQRQQKETTPHLLNISLLLIPPIPLPRPPPPPSSFTLQPFTVDGAKRILLNLLRPSESVLNALRRLGGSTGHPKIQTKQKNVRTNKTTKADIQPAGTAGAGGGGGGEENQPMRSHGREPGDENERKAAFSLLTDLCAQAVGEGWLDVYQCTYQQLIEEMKQEEGEVEFVWKRRAEDSVQRGPFTAAELRQALTDGEVQREGVVRRVGETRWQPMIELNCLTGFS